VHEFVDLLRGEEEGESGEGPVYATHSEMFRNCSFVGRGGIYFRYEALDVLYMAAVVEWRCHWFTKGSQDACVLAFYRLQAIEVEEEHVWSMEELSLCFVLCSLFASSRRAKMRSSSKPLLGWELS